MEYSLSSSLVGGSGSINPDELSLDLQFATDKTLTARKGPTPDFTRGSGDNGGTTYFAPSSINVSYTYASTPYNVNVIQRLQSGVINGNRWDWGDSLDTLLYYNPSNSSWELEHDGNSIATSAPTTAYRPDLANWGGTGVTVAATSTFGIVKAANNEPRFYYDPSTLESRGLLIEEQRSNLVFPSEALTTQTRTVTAVAHTLSFYGTGTIVLSGAHGATVTGTGAFPTRTTLTFTPSAGSLILTVTGTVTKAQLEAGAFATSYIPTVASSLTRSADVCSISGVSSFYEGSGTILVGSQLSPISSLNGVCAFTQASNQIMINRLPNNTRGATFGASPTLTINSGTLVSTLFVKSALAFNTNDAAFANNGVISGTSSSVALPSVDTFCIGSNGGQTIQSGTISEIKFFKKRLTNAKLQSLTEP